jgi:hypothetical protein
MMDAAAVDERNAKSISLLTDREREQALHAQRIARALPRPLPVGWLRWLQLPIF